MADNNITNLSPEKKRELLVTLLQQQASQSQSVPLSFAQQRLWFLEQLEPGTSAHHMPLGCRLTGRLDVTLLERSLSEIVRRHQILRTTFPTIDEQPVQVISPEFALKLPVIDLRELPESDRAAKVKTLVQQETERPFNLARGPLWRVKLLRLSAEEYLLHLTMHHAVFDGWSIEIFFRELVALYEAFASEKPLSLPELPIQYANFARWQRQWLQGEVLESQLSYWKQQLGGQLPVLELPADRQRPPVQTYRSAAQPLELPKHLTEEIELLCQQEEVTLFILLLAAFQTLLYRYSGQEDIVVGSPIAGRNQPGTKGLIGCFINMLVLRSDLSGNPSFQELLCQTREVALGAYAHQDLPFEKLIEQLQPERDLSRSPLFQVMLNLQNARQTSWQLPDLTVTPIAHSGTAQFDLTLELQQTPTGISGWFEYNPDLFEAATVTRMAGHFQQLLAGIVANPKQRIGELPLLTDAERHQLLVEWNRTEVDYPKEACIHHLVEEQVERHPNAVAVRFADQQLTYRQLNDRADRLARRLQSLGAGPEKLVGLCAQRSPDLLVGLLGILKAGSAYVPLDPTYPQERLSFMLADAKVSLLLTQQQLVERFPDHRATVVCLDADWEISSQQRQENLADEVTSDNLAYTIYTSGSTGKPKGVQICHRAVVNFLTAMSRQLELTSEDILLAVTTLSFDIAVLELLAPLTVGGCAMLVGRAVAADGTQLLATLCNSGATLMQATPATWRMLLEAGWRGDRSLKILCGGEALSPELAHQLRDRGALLWNLYGPTETTIWSTADRVRSEGHSVSIGRPIANTQIYILDSHLQPVPVGVAGELHIGGVGLARGYLNRPELTVEKFIAHPFSDKFDRLYKTGDLARYLPDGKIELLGRIDRQVKLRGFRMEIGEIESTLEQHPTVWQVVVALWENQSSDRRLVAYVVLHRGQNATSEELRYFLRQKLPNYMVPSTFMRLDALPLTPNGKVDRRALPEPIKQELETFVAPRDAWELQLTKIWEKVLGIQPIGIRDNFFYLGGHSLLTVRLVTEIEKAFDKKLPLAALFQAPTVEQLVGILRQDKWSAPWFSLVPIQTCGDKPPLFGIHILGGGFSFYRVLANYLGCSQPVYALHYGIAAKLNEGQQVANLQDNLVEVGAAEYMVNELAAHYLQEIQTLQPDGPYFLAGISYGGIIAMEMAQQLQKQGRTVALISLFDTYLPGAFKALTIRWFSLKFSKVLQLGPAYVLEKVQEKVKEQANRWSNRANSWRKAKRLTDRVRANKTPLKKYVPQAYTGKLTLFRATDRTPLAGYDIDPTLNLSDLAVGGLEIHDVPGSHLSMFAEPHVQVLAEKLNDCIDNALTKPSD